MLLRRRVAAGAGKGRSRAVTGADPVLLDTSRQAYRSYAVVLAAATRGARSMSANAPLADVAMQSRGPTFSVRAVDARYRSSSVWKERPAARHKRTVGLRSSCVVSAKIRRAAVDGGIGRGIDPWRRICRSTLWWNAQSHFVVRIFANRDPGTADEQNEAQRGNNRGGSPCLRDRSGFRP